MSKGYQGIIIHSSKNHAMTFSSPALLISLLLFLSIHKINAFIATSRHVLNHPTTTVLRKIERAGSRGSRSSSGVFATPPRFQHNNVESDGQCEDGKEEENVTMICRIVTSRKIFLKKSSSSLVSAAVALTALPVLPQEAVSKCADIESCREIGERKVEQDMIDNPTIRLESGARYKVLQPGIDGGDNNNNIVQPDSNIDMIFSISTLSGGYMYSRGFGFEKIDIGDNKLQSDAGLDSLRVQLGKRDVPLGIEDALIGMKKGERRRVELPPRVGFETSQWKPEPTTKRGKARIVGYRQLIEGNGSTRPPFPAATIWDIEVLRIRK